MLRLTLIYCLELHSFLWPFPFLSLCSLSCSPWALFVVLLTMLSSLLRWLSVCSCFSPEIWSLMFRLTLCSSLSQVLIFLLNSLFAEVMASCGFFLFFSMFGHNFILIGGNSFSGKCSPFVRKFWCVFASFILRVTLHYLVLAHLFLSHHWIPGPAICRKWLYWREKYPFW